MGFNIVISILAAALGVAFGELSLLYARRKALSAKASSSDTHTAHADASARVHTSYGNTSAGIDASKRPSYRLIFDIVSAGVCLLLAMRYGLTIELVEMLVIALALLMLCATDIASRSIPNVCIIIILCARLAYLLFIWWISRVNLATLLGQSVLDALIVFGVVALLGFIVSRLTHAHAIGAGDLKLFFAVAFCFGIRGSIIVILVACASGILFSLYQRHTYSKHANRMSNDSESRNDSSGRAPASRAIAFGPHIAIGCFVMALFGPEIILWYESLLLV